MDVTKHSYEKIEIEILLMSDKDVISTSRPFDGEDDNIGDWT